MKTEQRDRFARASSGERAGVDGTAGGSAVIPVEAVGVASADGPEAVSAEALALLFQEFSESTLKLRQSHEHLEGRVLELRRQLAEKDQQLERKKRLEALGLMVAGVAHEVRNPLGGISLYLDCLAQELRSEPSRDECLRIIGRIEESVTHLDSVVESMLVFSRSSATRQEMCNLPRLIDEALHLLYGDIERTGTRVTRGSESADASRLGDPDQLRCVFVNVIKNAIQSLDESSSKERSPGESLNFEKSGDVSSQLNGDVSIEFNGDVEGEQWCGAVVIRDNGAGIPEENLEKVFVPFFTEGKKKGGVGLGMAIVHSLMEQNGGRVELQNRAEGGLEVRLEFGRPQSAGKGEE